MDSERSPWLQLRPKTQLNGSTDPRVEDREFLRKRVAAAMDHARDLQMRCRHLREAMANASPNYVDRRR